MLEAKLERVGLGISDDVDEEDPAEAFRSQYLNAWPVGRVAASSRDEPLVDQAAWSDAANDHMQLPNSPLIVSIEDWFGRGAAAAVAALLADGRVFVAGMLFAGRAQACSWAANVLTAHPESRLLVGASLIADAAVVAATAATVTMKAEPMSTTATATALPTVRQLISERRLMHDGSAELSGQMLGMRVSPSRAGGLLVSSRSQRSDLARCAAWAVTVATRAEPVIEPPAIF